MRRTVFFLVVSLLSCKGEWESTKRIDWKSSFEFQDPGLQLLVHVDHDSVTVDQAIRAEFVLTVDGDNRAGLPDPKQIPLKSLVLKRWRTAVPEITDNGSHRERLLLTLEPMLPGEGLIGPLDLRYEKEEDGNWVEHSLKVEPIPIIVLSMGVPEEGPIEFKPPRGVAWRKKSILPYIIGGFVAAGFLFGLSYWFFLRRARRVTPTIPPHLSALRELTDLEHRSLVEKGELKRYYVELSGVLRSYVERAFEIPALELTTEEFVSTLREVDRFKSQHRRDARDLLEEADLVKFAKFHPGSEKAKERLYSAKDFVRSTAPCEEETDGV